MRVDMPKQIIAATSLLGSLTTSMGTAHCYCGEVRSLYLQPVTVKDPDKGEVEKIYLDALAPDGRSIHLYLANDMQEAMVLFNQIYAQVMNPEGPATVYVDIPKIIQDQLAQAIEETVKESIGEGSAQPQSVDGDPVGQRRVFIPRVQPQHRPIVPGDSKEGARPMEEFDG